MFRGEFYPSITSITPGGWREKIAEAHKLGLKQVCFFPTCIHPPERPEAYKLLEQSGIDFIPLVHMREDFEPGEIQYLQERFGTRYFNTHSTHEYPLQHDLSEHFPRILLESTKTDIREELPVFGGFCPDFNHLEINRTLNPELYRAWMQTLAEFPVLAAHIGAYPGTNLGHVFTRLSDFDYVAGYSSYLPEICALELENPLCDQLKAGDYLKKLLS